MDKDIKFKDSQIQQMLQQLPFQVGHTVYFLSCGVLCSMEFYYIDEADHFFDEIQYQQITAERGREYAN